MSRKTCRICANNVSFYFPMTSKYENLPLSIIVQVICPIKIEENDNKRPQEICAECYNVVIGAYRIREISLKSDRIFREFIDGKETQPKVKNATVVSSDEDTTDSFGGGKNSHSVVSDDDVMEDEESLLVEVVSPEDENTKDQSLLKQKQDEIINRLYEGLVIQSNPKTFELPLPKDNLLRNSIENVDKKFEPNTKTKESAFTCSYRNCGEKFVTSKGYAVHYAFEHSDILQKPSNDSRFIVKIDKTQKRTVFKNFGSLCKKDGTIVESSFLYCKMCVDKGIRRTFSKQTNYGNLVSHVMTKHNIKDYLPKEGQSGVSLMPSTSSTLRRLSPHLSKHPKKKSETETKFDEDSSRDSNEMNKDWTSLDFVMSRTEKGNVKFIIDGHVFTRDRQDDNRTNFRCQKQKHGCRSRGTFDRKLKKITKFNPLHNHN